MSPFVWVSNIDSEWDKTIKVSYQRTCMCEGRDIREVGEAELSQCPVRGPGLVEQGQLEVPIGGGSGAEGPVLVALLATLLEAPREVDHGRALLLPGLAQRHI